jgi:hypothetical protein
MSALINASCAGKIKTENCDLVCPPLNAGVDGNHGIYFFIYPKYIEDLYSGCQIMWDENGFKWYILSYSNGVIENLLGNSPDGDQIICKYRNGELVSGDKESCFAYDQLKNGLYAFQKTNDVDIKIPPERDLRLNQSRCKQTHKSLKHE